MWVSPRHSIGYLPGRFLATGFWLGLATLSKGRVAPVLAALIAMAGVLTLKVPLRPALRAHPDPTVFLTADRRRTMAGQGPVYLVARRGKLPRALKAVEGVGFKTAAEFRKVVVLSRMP